MINEREIGQIMEALQGLKEGQERQDENFTRFVDTATTFYKEHVNFDEARFESVRKQLNALQVRLAAAGAVVWLIAKFLF